MKILLTGGGTAGHIMPHIALIPELKKHFKHIYYIGSNGMEKDLIENINGVTFFEIEVAKFNRQKKWQLFTLPFKLMKSIKQAKNIIKKLRPDIVFSKGGYVSVPVAIAAKKLGIPVISHESDITMGLANKLIYHYAKVMCTSFPETAKRKKCICTGSPIRAELFKGNKNNILYKKQFNQKLPNIMFMGGSKGAKAINNFVFNNISELSKKYNICHIVGKNNKREINISNYYQIEFANNIEDCFDFADIMVTRSGANVLFELLALKKPMILIPLPKSASRGDQIENAKSFCKKGYAEMIEQEQLSCNMLNEKINYILKNKKQILENFSKSKIKDANKCILEVILNNVKTN